MKISTFIQIYEDRVWNSLTKEFVNLSSNDIEFIKKYKNVPINATVPNNLIDLGIVTTVEEERKLIEQLKLETRDSQFQSLYLIASTACNLDCDYCFYRSSASDSLKYRQKYEKNNYF